VVVLSTPRLVSESPWELSSLSAQGVKTGGPISVNDALARKSATVQSRSSMRAMRCNLATLLLRQLMLSADKSLFYDLNEVGILVRKFPIRRVPTDRGTPVSGFTNPTLRALSPSCGSSRSPPHVPDDSEDLLLAPNRGRRLRDCSTMRSLYPESYIGENENESAQALSRERASGVPFHVHSGTAPADETRKSFSIGDQRPVLQCCQDGPPANSYRIVGSPSILRPLGLRVRTAGLPPHR
jgi:hypothetical protein